MSRPTVGFTPKTEGGKKKRGAVLYGPRNVRFEERAAPKIIKPTDAVIGS